MGRLLSRAGFPYERDQKKVITFNSRPVKSTDFDLKGEVCGIQGVPFRCQNHNLGPKININSQEKKSRRGVQKTHFKMVGKLLEKLEL